MSTSATIAGLVGAFGAGTIIATGLKSQLDRVEKFRDRQIQAAEEFLTNLSDADRKFTAAVRLAMSNPSDLERNTPEIRALLLAARDRIIDVRRVQNRIAGNFNPGSLTGRLLRRPSVGAVTLHLGNLGPRLCIRASC